MAFDRLAAPVMRVGAQGQQTVLHSCHDFGLIELCIG